MIQNAQVKVHKRTDEWMMDGNMEGRIDGNMERLMNGWMDGRIDGCAFAPQFFNYSKHFYRCTCAGLSISLSQVQFEWPRPKPPPRAVPVLYCQHQ